MAITDGAKVAGGRVMDIGWLNGSPALRVGAGVSGSGVSSSTGDGVITAIGKGVIMVTGGGVSMLVGEGVAMFIGAGVTPLGGARVSSLIGSGVSGPEEGSGTGAGFVGIPSVKMNRQ